nr:formin-like protein 14 [Camelus dromedarius]
MQRKADVGVSARRKWEGAVPAAPSSTEDALHKQLDKHGGQGKGGGLQGAEEAAQLKWSPQKKGAEAPESSGKAYSEAGTPPSPAQPPRLPRPPAPPDLSRPAPGARPSPGDPYHEPLPAAAPGRRSGCSGFPPPPGVLPASSSGTPPPASRDAGSKAALTACSPAFQPAPDPPLPLLAATISDQRRRNLPKCAAPEMAELGPRGVEAGLGEGRGWERWRGGGGGGGLAASATLRAEPEGPPRPRAPARRGPRAAAPEIVGHARGEEARAHPPAPLGPQTRVLLVPPNVSKKTSLGAAEAVLPPAPDSDSRASAA